MQSNFPIQLVDPAPHVSNSIHFFLFRFVQVITWFQNRRAKLKRDMEEQKKDVESVKVLFTHKTFLENVHDLGILKKKAIHDSTTSLVQPGSPE